MPSDRDERVADFVKPFRVKPGSKVSLGKDFDPAFKSGLGSKKEAKDLLARGIELLAEYQSRLYAQDTHGDIDSGRQRPAAPAGDTKSIGMAMADEVEAARLYSV